MRGVDEGQLGERQQASWFVHWAKPRVQYRKRALGILFGSLDKIEPIQELRRCLARLAVGQGALGTGAVGLLRAHLADADPRRAAGGRESKQQD